MYYLVTYSVKVNSSLLTSSLQCLNTLPLKILIAKGVSTCFWMYLLIGLAPYIGSYESLAIFSTAASVYSNVTSLSANLDFKIFKNFLTISLTTLALKELKVTIYNSV